MRQGLGQATACWAAVLALGSVPAVAGTYVEQGDAGDGPQTAARTGSVGALTGIAGSNPGGALVGDVDAYRLCLEDPLAFSAKVTGGTQVDNQLFLFDAAGLGIVANDDEQAGVLRRAFIRPASAFSPTAPGAYVLAISDFRNEPVSAGGRIFPVATFATASEQFGPVGPGGGQPVMGWEGGGVDAETNGGTYVMELTGTGPCLRFTGFDRAKEDAEPGSTVQLRYALTDVAHAAVTDPAHLVSLTSTEGGGTCGTAAGLTEPARMSLVDEGDGHWRAQWKTSRLWAGQCRTATLTFEDGSSRQHTLRFRG